MRARYADGRAATIRDVMCTLTADGLLVSIAGAQQLWAYAKLRRTDDHNGHISLKRQPDTGERLSFEQEAEAALRAAAPALWRPRAHGVESLRTLGALVAGAWTLALAFLVGVPLAAEPIAGVIPPRYRSKIADISWSQVDAFTDYCDDSDEGTRILNDLAYRMMDAANLAQREEVWITIVRAPIPNAFALPDNSIIVTDDLIAIAEHPDELAGVIAHEIAHIEHNHIMKNIIRSVGAGIFFDVVFGGAGTGQAIAIASVNLAGLRFSRGDESDADSRGLEYLEAAGINPGGLARLFERFEELAGEQGGEIPALISSHPASAARAAAARARARTGLAPSLSDVAWRTVRASCGGTPEPTPEPARAPTPAPVNRPAKLPDLDGAPKPP
jgi:Zn-dependent protease with chaperone function